MVLKKWYFNNANSYLNDLTTQLSQHTDVLIWNQGTQKELYTKGGNGLETCLENMLRRLYKLLRYTSYVILLQIL